MARSLGLLKEGMPRQFISPIGLKKRDLLLSIRE